MNWHTDSSNNLFLLSSNINCPPTKIPNFPVLEIHQRPDAYKGYSLRFRPSARDDPHLSFWNLRLKAN